MVLEGRLTREGYRECMQKARVAARELSAHPDIQGVGAFERSVAGLPISEATIQRLVRGQRRRAVRKSLLIPQ